MNLIVIKNCTYWRLVACDFLLRCSVGETFWGKTFRGEMFCEETFLPCRYPYRMHSTLGMPYSSGWWRSRVDRNPQEGTVPTLGAYVQYGTVRTCGATGKSYLCRLPKFFSIQNLRLRIRIYYWDVFPLKGQCRALFELRDSLM